MHATTSRNKQTTQSTVKERITLSFDLVDLAVIAIGAIIGVTALAILRLHVEPSRKKECKKYSSFLLMEGDWLIVGLIFGVLYRMHAR